VYREKNCRCLKKFPSLHKTPEAISRSKPSRCLLESLGKLLQAFLETGHSLGVFSEGCQYFWKILLSRASCYWPEGIAYLPSGNFGRNILNPLKRFQKIVKFYVGRFFCQFQNFKKQKTENSICWQ
jgi:hypothetical protein